MINKYSNILMSIYEKGMALSSIYSPYMMWKLAKHKDVLIRSDLAKALVYDTESEVALDILCKLSRDKESLVRVEAVASLSEYCCVKSYKVLKNALYDSDYLVRKYALFGIAYIGKKLNPEETIELLQEYDKKEVNLHCKVSIYEGLYMLGQQVYLDKLMNLFWNDDYQIQCSVANSLSEVIEQKNVPVIRKFLHTLKIEEYSVAVKSSIENLNNVCLELEGKYE